MRLEETVMEPLVINRSDPTPIHAQITRHLKSQIISGAFPRGRRLPSVRDMIRDFGVSVGTIQRVVRDLQADGLVNGRRGSGIFVSELGGGKRRTPGLLWVDSLEKTFAGDSTRVQNDFQRAAPGARIKFRKHDADVIELGGDYVAQHAGELMDVGEVIEEVYGRSRDEPALFKRLQVNGRSVLMPLIINPSVMICNVTMFEAMGIPLPHADWTWSDCLRLARELTRPEQGQYGFHPNAADSLHHCGVWQNGGSILSKNGEETLADEDVSVEFCQILRALGRCCPPDVCRLHEPQTTPIERFVAGEIGMFLGSIWHPYSLHEQKRTRWTCVPLPRGETRAGQISALGFGVRKASPVPELARDFLRLAGQLEKWPDRPGYSTGLHLHADLQQHDQVENAFRRMAECSRTLLSDVQPECRSPRQKETLRLFTPALVEVISSSAPIRPIMRRAKQSMDMLLGQHKDVFQRW